MTPYCLTPDQYPLLLMFGIGLTDLVKRKSGQDVRLSTEDFDVVGFHAKIEKCAPKAVGFNEKKSAKVYFGKSTVEYGVQIAKIEGTALFVLPSTSGAARGFWDSKYWFQLAKFVSR